MRGSPFYTVFARWKLTVVLWRQSVVPQSPGKQHDPCPAEDNANALDESSWRIRPRAGHIEDSNEIAQDERERQRHTDDGGIGGPFVPHGVASEVDREDEACGHQRPECA
jgi:hypothetical protein